MAIVEAPGHGSGTDPRSGAGTGSGTDRRSGADPDPTALARSLSFRRAIESLDEQMAALCVAEVPVPMADRLAATLARHERIVADLRTALVRRVTASGHHEASGRRDAVTHLAQLTGVSRGKAKATLDLAERVAKLPGVEDAVRSGEISTDQARVIASAAEADPEATDELISAAREQPMGQLRLTAARKERSARGEEHLEAKERRVHERRYCRTWTPRDGGLRLEAWVTASEGAKLLAALDTKTAALLKKFDEGPERLQADALVALVTGERVRTDVSVRVDAAALVRGAVEGDEVCEMPGVGPVSVRVARALLGDAFLTFLVRKGTDVSTVTSTTRVIPRTVRKALEDRDPCCVVPGCGATYHLEIDHWRIDFEKTGPTELDNLCRLCSVHHRQKTNGIIRLCGGPGRWVVRPGRMAGRVPPPGRYRSSSARAGP